ncbi:acyl-coenzyme A synthetase ACSM3, mitochondrial isoform X1 [Polypterus senegalus]|nr:acyl-coenzyme A synthetase ACSM3, mitochondrial isoform X1 [Polypterus senegalus]XP_039632473.1 acyl-coenzyme A synthetase ACSM3, mitochondrial isoform X1 [Polypterus senegalus]
MNHSKWIQVTSPSLRHYYISLKRKFHEHSKLQVSIPKNFKKYEDLRQLYNPHVPEYFNFARDVLDSWSEKEKVKFNGHRPLNPALWWVNESGEEIKWSFQELGVQSKIVANILSEACDLQIGDRVLLILPRIPEWWFVNIACFRTGTILIPGTSQLTAKDILYRLQSSKAKCIVTDVSLASLVDAVASECEFLKAKLLVSDKKRLGWINIKEVSKSVSHEHTCVATKSSDPMTIFFTSGTTGSPKMTQHTHSSFGIGLEVNGRFWLDLTPEDVMWNTSDTGWAKSAWSSIFAPWIQGACVFVHQMPRFDSKTILETLSRFNITTFCSAPTAYRMLVQHDLNGYSFKSLKHCVSAGEPINPEVMACWKKKTGLDIYDGYGQTETVLICGTFKGMKIKPGSMGKPSPAYDVKIIDENGKPVPCEQEGDIAIRVKPTRPISLFSGYIDDPERALLCYRGDYYLTGDRGKMDKDGYIWFVGRSDDVILSSGYRIGPFEVENALIEHPSVAESAVVSSPDPVRGEVVKAYVVLTPEYKLHDPKLLTTELQNHVKKVTAPYKYPRKIEFVDQLPKTISGKIIRAKLRNKEWGKNSNHV